MLQFLCTAVHVIISLFFVSFLLLVLLFLLTGTPKTGRNAKKLTEKRENETKKERIA